MGIFRFADGHRVSKAPTCGGATNGGGEGSAGAGVSGAGKRRRSLRGHLGPPAESEGPPKDPQGHSAAAVVFVVFEVDVDFVVQGAADVGAFDLFLGRMSGKISNDPPVGRSRGRGPSEAV